MIISKFKEKETEKKKATWNIADCDAYNISVFNLF